MAQTVVGVVSVTLLGLCILVARRELRVTVPQAQPAKGPPSARPRPFARKHGDV